MDNVVRKDDDWILSRGVYIFVSIGLLLLLGAISAVIVVIKPWTVREYLTNSHDFAIFQLHLTSITQFS